MSAFTTDGDYTIAQPHGGRRITFPFERDPTAQILEQDYQQFLDDFVPLDLNTPHPDYPDFFLIAESAIQNMGAGVGQWTRIYATIPAQRNEYETFSYTFPGLYSQNGATPPYNQYWDGADDGRDPFTTAANSRLQYDYFLIGPGQTYTTPDEIPEVEAQEYTLASNDNAVITYLLPEGEFWSDSVPTKEEWQAMITGGTEFVMENSRLENFRGNIWCRITRYGKAK